MAWDRLRSMLPREQPREVNLPFLPGARGIPSEQEILDALERGEISEGEAKMFIREIRNINVPQK